MIQHLVEKHISNKLNPNDLILLNDALKNHSEETINEVLRIIWEKTDTASINKSYSDLVATKFNELFNSL